MVQDKPLAVAVTQLVLTVLLTAGMAFATSYGTPTGGAVAFTLGVAAFMVSARTAAAAVEMFEPPELR